MRGWWLVAAVAGLCGSVPRAAVAAEPAKDPFRFRPSVALGGLVGSTHERWECEAEAPRTCPAELEREVGLGAQAAPLVEGVVMLARSGGGLGLGVRYVPGLALDSGSELHFAIVPELRGVLSPGWMFSGRLFNSFLVGFPPQRLRERQALLAQACRARTLGCDEFGSNLGLAVALELGLLQELDGYRLRYHLGVQSVILHNSATASAEGDETERFWGHFEHQSNRLVSHVGVEW